MPENNNINSGQKASVNIEVKAVFGENAHILIGGKIINIPLASLKLT